MIAAETYSIPLPAPGAAGLIIVGALLAMLLLPWHPDRYMRGRGPRRPRRPRRGVRERWTGEAQWNAPTLPRRPRPRPRRPELPPRTRPPALPPPREGGRPRAVILRPDMPERPHISPELRAYYAGEDPGVPTYDGVPWPTKVKRWMLRHDGSCELSSLLARRGIHVCTGSAEQADHKHYATVFRESRRDVALVCRPCHVAREQLKDDGVNVYAEAVG